MLLPFCISSLPLILFSTVVQMFLIRRTGSWHYWQLQNRTFFAWLNLILLKLLYYYNISYLSVSAFSLKSVLSDALFMRAICAWSLYLYLVRFKLWVVSRLSFKFNIFSFINWSNYVWFLQMLGTILCLIRCGSIKFPPVGLIWMITSLWSLNLNLVRHITFFVLRLTIKGLIIWSILEFWFLLMLLNFVWWVVLFIGSFNQVGIIMSFLIIVMACLSMFRNNFIPFVIMMISCFCLKLDWLRRAMMFTYIILIGTAGADLAYTLMIVGFSIGNPFGIIFYSLWSQHLII